MSGTAEDRAYRNAYRQAYRDFAARHTRGRKVFKCYACGAADNRDQYHQRGCPQLEPVSPEDLLRLARTVEAGWGADNARREARRTARAKPIC